MSVTAPKLLRQQQVRRRSASREYFYAPSSELYTERLAATATGSLLLRNDDVENAGTHPDWLVWMLENGMACGMAPEWKASVSFDDPQKPCVQCHLARIGQNLITAILCPCQFPFGNGK